MEKPSFAIVGCGRLGTAMGKQLVRAGYPLAGLTSRSIASIEETARIIVTDRFSDNAREVTRDADVVFITTPDGVISRACESLAKQDAFKKGAVVLHCSGAHPSTILAAAENAGAATGSMHPLQSFAAKTLEGNPFSGIIISVEGKNPAVSVARKMARDLGADCLTIPTHAKTLYHASAVVASNYLVTIIDLAVKLMKTANISENEAFAVLKPLVNGTLSNIEKVGAVEALTGPIARGDAETVSGHLADIEKTTPELAELYKVLGRYTVEIAKAKGGLDKDALEGLGEVLM